MPKYYNTVTKQIQDIPNEIIEAWTLANNPKLDILIIVLDPPSYNIETQKPPIFINGTWVIQDKTEEEKAADARKVWTTASDYLLEFTFEEMVQISLSTNPTIAGLRLLLTVWIGEVWSDDVRVLSGLDALEATGIITSERRQAILTK